MKNLSTLFAELACYSLATFIITVGIVASTAIAASEGPKEPQQIAFTMSANH